MQSVQSSREDTTPEAPPPPHPITIVVRKREKERNVGGLGKLSQRRQAVQRRPRTAYLPGAERAKPLLSAVNSGPHEAHPTHSSLFPPQPQPGNSLEPDNDRGPGSRAVKGTTTTRTLWAHPPHVALAEATFHLLLLLLLHGADKILHKPHLRGHLLGQSLIAVLQAAEAALEPAGP